MKKIFSLISCLLMCYLCSAQIDSLGNDMDNTLDVGVEIQPNGLERRWHAEDVSTIKSPLKLHEDSLVFLADSMYESADVAAREAGNYYFIKVLKNTFKLNGCNTYPFENLSKKINIINTSDNGFRIYNWEVIRANNEHRYYGVIVKANGKLLPLVDVSGKIISGEEDSVFSAGRWYGASYYKMIEKRGVSGDYYFLLGFNGNNANYNLKLMDVLYFNKKDEAVFGGGFFMHPTKKGNPICNRYVLYYQKDARISMNLDEELNMIIHDHLESSTGDPAKRTTLAPDGTYDGLVWRGGGWQIKPNAVQIDPLSDGQAPNTQTVPATGK